MVMKLTHRICVRTLSAILIAVYMIVSLAGCSNPVLNSTLTSPKLEENSPTISQLKAGEIRVSDLPPEARTTLHLVKSGGPFPYSKDGAIFNNFEGLLPKQPAGYYHEYTVITPGSADRGARRIIAGATNKYYYTDDHYISFKLIEE
jgi:ribonuclease T1